MATGVCACLEKTDYIESTHRGHGHTIAKGADLKPMMAELHGKATGCCRGKGGSQHIADFSIGMLGANGIVGGGFGLAVGAALAARGIAVRTGIHCAPLAHRTAGTLESGTVRVSFSDFNRPDEVHRFLTALEDCLH